MADHSEEKNYPLEEALRAQKSLRDLAGLPAEEFPLPAFVGMVSDEIEALRNQGRSDTEIAGAITSKSKIKITAEQIAQYYAPPEQRQQHHE